MALRALRHLIACGVILGMAPAFIACGQSLPEAWRHARTKRFMGGRRLANGASAAEALAQARQQHLAMVMRPESSNLSATWTAVGPQQVASTDFGAVTGRVTSIAIDPADASGNTVYIGTTGGGVWKSANAAGTAAEVSFVPLTDTLPVFAAGSQVIPSLSIGAVAAANGVVLAGTGDPNDATDSYYGAGILRSADGGATWTLAQQSTDGATGNHAFFGLSSAGFAFSSGNPSLVVAAMSRAAEGGLVNAVSSAGTVAGLYWSSDAGVTWRMATVMDGSVTVQQPLPPGSSDSGNAATSVVWNPVRQRFYAAVQYHGYYQSADGMTWTRLPSQPGAGLTLAACPSAVVQPSSGSACPILRGVLAVQPITGDMFALTVDSSDRSQGLYQDACALQGSACGNATVAFGTALNGTPLTLGGGSTAIQQGDYDLSLAAVSSGADTLLYVGTVDLYRCSLAAGCILRNTTNAENGCTNTALVAPAQHAIATLANASGPLIYLGNDGGVWRSTDGVNESGSACSLFDATHFQNLNAGIGSLAEVVSFTQDPSAANILLAGLGALGTAGTSTVTSSWAQLATGEGGTVAIDPSNPLLWYLSNGAGVNVARCAKGSGCTASDFSVIAIGATQVGGEVAAVHAPLLLDPTLTQNLIVGTCRVWRGPASGGTLWPSANEISAPLGAQAASTCTAASPVVRSLAAGGALSASSSAQNSGSTVLYAGMAGTLDGGASVGGHLFESAAANLANGAIAWKDLAASPVTNDVADAGKFNPGGFDISSVASDPHDATGATVYATAMGFQAGATNAPHLYRSIDMGAHWTNISSNLPNAPANSVIVDPNDANTLYVALDTGVYVTTQVTSCVTTNCWSVYGISLPNAPVIELLAAAGVTTGDGRTGELRAATYGRGIWEIPLLTAIASTAPAISINPLTATYPGEPVGTVSPFQTFTVTNTGTAPLLVSRVTTTGDFNESDACAGTTVAQNATCTVLVRFLPSATGTRNGLLTVYGNVTGGQATAALSGTGVAGAAVVLTPLSLTFTATSVGSSSTVQAITLANTGGVAVALQVPAITGDFKVAANTCGSSLAPSTGCTLSIAFVPSASGSRQGTLTITDDAGTQVASLSGTGTNPATDTLSPLSLSFAAQQLSTASAAQQLTLVNAGDVALTLIAAQVASGDFNVVNSCGNSLNAHSTCAMSVTYSPRSVGPQSGSVTVTDQFRSQTVQLSGTGLAPPGVSLSPANGLAFGATGLGLSSATQTVTLTNNGGVALTIATVTASGDFSVLPGSNTCGSLVAPAAVCTAQIVFLPTITGVRTGTVTYLDNAANSPQTVALAGTGVDFSLASNGPTSLTISSGQSASYALLLTAAAGLPGSAAFTCAGVPAHTMCTVNPASAALGGSTSVTVTVATGLTTVELQEPRMPWSDRAILFAALLPLGLLWPFKLHRSRGAWRPLLIITLAVMLSLLTACSTARTIPADTLPTATMAVTPSGTYTLVVAGSSVGLVRSVNLTLVVK